MEDSAAPMLSKEDLVTYERDGVVLIRNVLSEEQIELGRSAIKPPSPTLGHRLNSFHEIRVLLLGKDFRNHLVTTKLPLQPFLGPCFKISLVRGDVTK